MKVLFTNPPWFTQEPHPEQAGRQILRRGIRAGSRWPFTIPSHYNPDNFQFGGYLPFPYFLASAAGYVALNPSYKVTFRDSIARGESYAAFFSALNHIRPDHVILEVGAASWDHDLQVIGIIKKMLPGVMVAVAGPTAKTASETDRSGLVDAWLLGEYEKNAARFVAGATGVLQYDLLTKEEMNTLPLPMVDDSAALNYWDACPEGQLAPHLQMLTSRGCPYKCCFCAWPATMTGNDPDGTKPRSVRFHSAAWVQNYITKFHEKYPRIRSVYFDDDTFNLNDRHVLEICEVMKHIGLPWTAMCRADTSKRETWMAMRDSGCRGVKLGFESGSQRVVDQIVNKKLNLKEAAETAIWLRQIGLSVHGTFTIGLPGETKEERAETVHFIKTLYQRGGLDTHQLSGTATIEGTPLDAISHGEKLAVYPGADNADFVRNHDGAKKAEDMR